MHEVKPARLVDARGPADERRSSLVARSVDAISSLLQRLVVRRGRIVLTPPPTDPRRMSNMRVYSGPQAQRLFARERKAFEHAGWRVRTVSVTDAPAAGRVRPGGPTGNAHRQGAFALPLISIVYERKGVVRSPTAWGAPEPRVVRFRMTAQETTEPAGEPNEGGAV